MVRTRQYGSCRDLEYVLVRLPKSTVIDYHWLCRDQEYVALKVYVRTPTGHTNREQLFYTEFGPLETDHPGALNVRPALGIFELTRNNGAKHICLICPPLQTILYAFKRLGGRPVPLPEYLVKLIMRRLLEALDFLHTKMDVTHCGTLPCFSPL